MATETCNMKLTNFMRSNSNWEKILSEPPYCLNIKYDGDFVILKYNQFDSDMSNPIVQEARGVIYHAPTLTPVCVPFFKFFNHIEPYAHEIDWDSAYVLEKIDGSLIKVWNYNNIWHISTNGMIDANKAVIDATGVSFGSLVERVIPFEKLTAQLDKNYTYMFELTCAENRVVVEYDDALYFLGRRNNLTLKEDFEMPNLPIRKPRVYNLNSFEDCVKIAAQMTDSEEGFVVCDKNFNRVKIKSAGWLNANYVKNMTYQLAYKMWKDGTIDDVRGMPIIENFINTVNEICEKMDEFYVSVKDKQRSEIAQLDSQYKAYVFARLNNKVKSANEFMLNIFKKKFFEMFNDWRGC